MNELAITLNKELESTVVYELLSEYGKRFYFPSKGIVAQAGEAKAKATRYNATVGMAFSEGNPIQLSQIKKNLSSLSESDAVAYAPTPGLPKLRDLWKEEIYRKNSELKDVNISRPMVTPGLTAGISQMAELFTEKGTNIVIPDMFWGNYRLIFEGKREAVIKPFTFFNSEGKFNLSEYKKTLIDSAQNRQIRTILNFPNNPTGYTPTFDEANEIQTMFKELAEDGYKILVLTDDAYFGLFFEDDTYNQSIFSKLANLHSNIFAVKIDGITKEHFAWGFRIGFITFGCKSFSDKQYNAIEQKLSGSLRATFSNSSRPAQSIMINALQDPQYEAERVSFDIQLKDRYKVVKEILSKRTNGKKLSELPFNSGYFMNFEVDGDAEKLRNMLLDMEQIGTISIAGKYLRVAFSAVEKRDLVDLYSRIFKVADSL